MATIASVSTILLLPEEVEWIVMRSPRTASTEQIETFRKAHGDVTGLPPVKRERPARLPMLNVARATQPSEAPRPGAIRD